MKANNNNYVILKSDMKLISDSRLNQTLLSFLTSIYDHREKFKKQNSIHADETNDIAR